MVFFISLLDRHLFGGDLPFTGLTSAGNQGEYMGTLGIWYSNNIVPLAMAASKYWNGIFRFEITTQIRHSQSQHR